MMSQGRYSAVKPPVLFLADLKNNSDVKTEAPDNELPALYRCPVGLGLMTRPMTILPCKHIIDEINILTWQAKHPENTPCPCCRGKITSLILNQDLKEVIDFYLKEQKQQQLKQQAHEQALAALAAENKKLVSESYILKTSLTTINKDSKSELYPLLDKNTQGLLTAQQALEKTLASVKAHLIAAEFRRIFYRRRIIKLFKKLSLEVKNKSEQAKTIKAETQKKTAAFQDKHLGLMAHCSINAKILSIDAKSVDAAKNQFLVLGQSITDWSATFLNLQKEALAIDNQKTLLNKTAKRLAFYYKKKFQGLNKSIGSLQAEVKNLLAQKVLLLQTSLNHSQHVMNKPPVFFAIKNNESSALNQAVKLEQQLINAVQANGDYAVISQSLQNGAHPDVPNLMRLQPRTYPPLFSCVFNARLDLIDLLLLSRANINFKANHCGHSKFNVDKYVIRHFDNMTPLIFAVKLHHCHIYRPEYKVHMPKVVDFLLSHGADINAADEQGMTALHWAAEYNDRVMVLKLLSKEPDCKKLNKAGRTPLDIANENRSAVIIELLNKVAAGNAAPVLAVSL